MDETCGKGNVPGFYCARYHSGWYPNILCNVNHDCPPFAPICFHKLCRKTWPCNTIEDCPRGYDCGNPLIPSEPYCSFNSNQPYWCMTSWDCPPETHYCAIPEYYCVAVNKTQDAAQQLV